MRSTLTCPVRQDLAQPSVITLTCKSKRSCIPDILPGKIIISSTWVCVASCLQCYLEEINGTIAITSIIHHNTCDSNNNVAHEPFSA